MPDKRLHRGRHPEDVENFAAGHWPLLRAAVHDLSWLLSHGYADKSALKLVGDRYNLRERQRIAVMRCACPDQSLAGRIERQVQAEGIADRTVLIDGYNVLTTIEAALADGIVIKGRDGCYRDMASMHGTFHTVMETAPALQLIGSVLAESRVALSVWYLDRPVSNSGRLKCYINDIFGQNAWPCRIQVVANPDTVLAAADEFVCTADSVILDRCQRWFNLAWAIVERKLPDTQVIDLS